MFGRVESYEWTVDEAHKMGWAETNWMRKMKHSGENRGIKRRAE